jgi:hypothetical protein
VKRYVPVLGMFLLLAIPYLPASVGAKAPDPPASAAIEGSAVFSLDWFSIDAGGATSTGGAFSLSGSFGQADAGIDHAGGAFVIRGGFWPGSEFNADLLFANGFD